MKNILRSMKQQQKKTPRVSPSSPSFIATDARCVGEQPPRESSTEANTAEKVWESHSSILIIHEYRVHEHRVHEYRDLLIN